MGRKPGRPGGNGRPQAASGVPSGLDLGNGPLIADDPYCPPTCPCWTPGALPALPSEQDNGAWTHRPACRAKVPPWRLPHFP